MKSSFADADKEIDTTTAAAPVEPTGAVAETASNAIVEDNFFGNEGYEGDIDQNVIRTPFLALVHGVGDLAEAGFNPGSLVYKKEIIMAQPTKGVMAAKDGVTITLLQGKAEYIEDITNDEYKAGLKAQRFPTEQAARNAGLISVKERRASGDMEAKVFRPASIWKVLIEGKTGDEGFPFEFGGKSYALAAVAFTKGSYWGAGTSVLNFVNECRMVKKPVYWKSFQLFTKLEKPPGAQNAVWSMQAAPGAKYSPEFVEFVKGLIAS